MFQLAGCDFYSTVLLLLSRRQVRAVIQGPFGGLVYSYHGTNSPDLPKPLHEGMLLKYLFIVVAPSLKGFGRSGSGKKKARYGKIYRKLSSAPNPCRSLNKSHDKFFQVFL